ncbi:DUF6279 family lipoprotein [Ramlibacter sp.]|uniref:DUF6279 family lipoprotein n=1 Tax=Ramlibacter sp. TaxID=1917967 RepID=UPI003D10F6B0
MRFGYGSLPELSYWWLDSYFDFTDEQDLAVRQELARLHRWHRATELPRAVELLGRMEKIATGPVTAAQACAFAPEIQARIEAVAMQAEPAAAAIAATFSPDQMRHLERKYGRNNADFRKDMVESPVRAREKQEKTWVDRFEMVYGNIEDGQRAALRQAIAQSIFDAPRMLRERQRRQQDLLNTLRRMREPGVTTAQSRALLRGYIDRVKRSPDPEYARYQEAMLEEGCRFSAAMHALTTPEQRAHAARRLRGWQRDFRELAAAD